VTGGDALQASGAVLAALFKKGRLSAGRPSAKNRAYRVLVSFQTQEAAIHWARKATRPTLRACGTATTGPSRITGGRFKAGNGVEVAKLVSVASETSMSLDLLTQYIDHALTFERMADAEPNQGLKADLERQASVYRRLAAKRARRLGLPLPSKPERHSAGGGRRDI
jgi:hypothetical protein